jgi:predicted dehydrogenase
MYATDLVAGGAIGRVIQVIGLGPHRLGKANRPAWFFEKAKFGGILTDIGSHQFEQFLTYTGATDATVTAGGGRQFRQPGQARVRGLRRGIPPRQQRRL